MSLFRRFLTVVCSVIDPLASSVHDPYSKDPPGKIVDAVEFGMVKSEALWVNAIASRYKQLYSYMRSHTRA